jgi:hypothetical protein
MLEKKSKEKCIKYELFQACDEFYQEFLLSRGCGPPMTNKDFRQAFLDGKYHWVETFELPGEDVEDQLEVVFYKSNNIDGSWRREIPCRSTSVGDLVKVGKDYWIVASIGFEIAWSE